MNTLIKYSFHPWVKSLESSAKFFSSTMEGNYFWNVTELVPVCHETYLWRWMQMQFNDVDKQFQNKFQKCDPEKTGKRTVDSSLHDSGRSVMKSTVRWDHGRCRGISFPIGNVQGTLACAHAVHKETHQYTSTSMLGRQNMAHNRWHVLCVPGWPVAGPVLSLSLKAVGTNFFPGREELGICWVWMWAISWIMSHVMVSMEQTGGRMCSSFRLLGSAEYKRNRKSALVFLEPGLLEIVKWNHAKIKARWLDRG